MPCSQSQPPPPFEGRYHRLTSISSIPNAHSRPNPNHHNNNPTNSSTTKTNTTTTTVAVTNPATDSPTAPTGKNAYLTLLTRGTYLPGVIILAHSLRKVGTRYPLIVAVTSSLPKACVDVLVAEGLRVELVAPIVPVWARGEETETGDEGGKNKGKDKGKGKGKGAMVADRFEDTWTKLVAFSFVEFDRILLLDADLLILHPLDPLFTLPLPPTHIAATPACICNLDHQPWAPTFWTPSNCAFSHPPASSSPLAPLPPPPTPTLNSGLLLLHPSLPFFSSILTTIHTSPFSPTFQFPDQDLLSEVFRGKWWPLGWMWNAVKTMRYWHPGVWIDESVRVVHYIVEKPWDVRRGEEGEDAVTVGWWRREWEEWARGRERGRVEEVEKWCGGLSWEEVKAEAKGERVEWKGRGGMGGREGGARMCGENLEHM